MAVVAALRDEYNTLNGGTVERQKIQLEDTIDQLEPGKAPFIVLLKGGLGARTVGNWKFHWMLDSPFPHIDAVNGTVNGCTAGASVTVTVDNGDYWQVWDTFVETTSFGVFRITARSTNDLTCTVIAAPTGNALADDTEIINTGSAYESGADFKAPRSTIETQDYSYGQIFRETVGMTEVQQMTEMAAGGGDWAYQARTLMPKFARKQERAFWFNERTYNTGGTHPYGMLRGLHRWAVQGGNVNASFGAFTMKKLSDELLPLVEADQETERKPYLFTSNAVLGIISRAAQASASYQMKQGETAFGVRITTLQTTASAEPLRIVVHPEFVQTTGLQAAGYFVMFDAKRLKYVKFSGNGVNLDTHMRVQVQDPGETIRVDEIYGMASLECHYPESCLAYLNTIQEAS